MRWCSIIEINFRNCSYIILVVLTGFWPTNALIQSNSTYSILAVCPWDLHDTIIESINFIETWWARTRRKPKISSMSKLNYLKSFLSCIWKYKISDFKHRKYWVYTSQHKITSLVYFFITMKIYNYHHSHTSDMDFSSISSKGMPCRRSMMTDA